MTLCCLTEKAVIYANYRQLITHFDILTVFIPKKYGVFPLIGLSLFR